MANEIIYEPIIPLQSKLSDCLHKGFGWILSESKNMAKHSDSNSRKLIQDSIDVNVQGLLIVYLFAMWEEYVPRTLENEWIPAGKLERLNAFRHIRHSIAHGFEGQRANKLRVEFNQVMNSRNPFANLQWDTDSINLTKSQVAVECHKFMEEIIKILIGRIANDNRP
jgi:hypothetical protein